MIVSFLVRKGLGMPLTARFAGWRLMNPLPGAAELPRRTESRLLGNAFHVEPRLAKQFMCVRHTETVGVLRNTHPGVFVEEARKMPIACARDTREHTQSPGFC